MKRPDLASVHALNKAVLAGLAALRSCCALRNDQGGVRRKFSSLTFDETTNP